jgi:hypothetical protein
MTPERRRELEVAYLDANYWVDGPACHFAIRVGATCEPLEELLRREHAIDWAFTTACNPLSQPLSDEVNLMRMSHLVADLSVAGYRFHPGEGTARDDSWKPEPSVFIVGISETKAIEIANRYGQSAIIVGKAAQPARLVWTISDTTTSNEFTRGTSP